MECVVWVVEKVCCKEDSENDEGGFDSDEEIIEEDEEGILKEVEKMVIWVILFFNFLVEDFVVDMIDEEILDDFC